MNEWLMNFVSANTITVAAGIGAGIWWIVHRSFSHDSQIKNLGTKIDHLDEKIGFFQENMDRMFANLKEYMDVRFKHLEDKIDTFEVRLSRVEGYLFDVRLKDQIQNRPIHHESKE